MDLHHFTCLWHLPSILERGITRGKMPDLDSGPDSPTPNLTSNPNRKPHAVWAEPIPGDENGITDKLRFRLSVSLTDRSRLKAQRDLWREQRIPRHIQKAYDPLGQSKFWYIHFGTVPANCITKIEEWNGVEYIPADLARMKAEHDLYEALELDGFRLIKLKAEQPPSEVIDQVRSSLRRAA